jgi:antitoxin PrlF
VPANRRETFGDNFGDQSGDAVGGKVIVFPLQSPYGKEYGGVPYMNAEAKITSKGQITLPSRVRDRLNVGPGDSVVFVEGHDGKIVVRSKSGTLSDMRGMLGGKSKPPSGNTIERWVNEARSRNWPASPKRRRKAR